MNAIQVQKYAIPLACLEKAYKVYGWLWDENNEKDIRNARKWVARVRAGKESISGESLAAKYFLEKIGN